MRATKELRCLRDAPCLDASGWLTARARRERLASRVDTTLREIRGQRRRVPRSFVVPSQLTGTNDTFSFHLCSPPSTIHPSQNTSPPPPVRCSSALHLFFPSHPASLKSRRPSCIYFSIPPSHTDRSPPFHDVYRLASGRSDSEQSRQVHRQVRVRDHLRVPRVA